MLGAEVFLYSCGLLISRSMNSGIIVNASKPWIEIIQRHKPASIFSFR